MTAAGEPSGEIDRLRREFRFFGEMCAGHSPLCAVLSARAADDDAVVALATDRQRGQSGANLLFAAVQYLLLAGADHPLASFYPSVGGDRPVDGAYPAFADFCRVFAADIRQLVRSRRVQTNEVGRCGQLLAAFAFAAVRFGGRPLALVEVGSSAGLALQFDRYRYEYTDSTSTLVCACGPPSDVVIQTELRPGRECPLPDRLPEMAGRTGIDTTPLDVADDDAMQWLAALIWADQRDRHERFRAAVRIARGNPVPCIAGDGVEMLPGVIVTVPSDHLPDCHTHGLWMTWLANNESQEFGS